MKADLHKITPEKLIHPAEISNRTVNGFIRGLNDGKQAQFKFSEELADVAEHE
jgi:hypothetical protein